jgi:hypothetical protein
MQVPFSGHTTNVDTPSKKSDTHDTQPFVKLSPQFPHQDQREWAGSIPSSSSRQGAVASKSSVLSGDPCLDPARQGPWRQGSHGESVLGLSGTGGGHPCCSSTFSGNSRFPRPPSPDRGPMLAFWKIVPAKFRSRPRALAILLCHARIALGGRETAR